jgi:hypothetical protein
MLEGFEQKFVPEPNSGCWLWLGAMASGYGTFLVNGKMTGAHRVAWQLYRGEISEGLFICHSCDVPSCVNPGHLFVGSNTDNQRDALNKGRHPLTSKTHCSNGHPLSGANLYIRPNGQRQCRACNRSSVAKYKRSRRAA